MRNNINNVEDLINSFSTEYYDNQIAHVQTRINNLIAGRDEWYGIYPEYTLKQYSTKEKQDKLNELKIMLEQLNKNKIEAARIIYELKSSMKKTEQLAERAALIYVLGDLLKDKENYSMLNNEKELEKEKQKIRKLYIKSSKTVTKATNKIEKAMYKKIKNNSKLYVTENSTIKTAFIKNEVNIKTAISRLKQEMEYGLLFKDNFRKAGIPIETIKYIENNMRGEVNTYNIDPLARESLQKLELLKSGALEKYGNNDELFKLKAQYQKIVNIARKVWFYNELIVTFSKTVITDSELYIGLMKLESSEKQKLVELIKVVDKKYEKLRPNIESDYYKRLRRITKEDYSKRLEELYKKIKSIETTIKSYKLDSFGIFTLFENEYAPIMEEMFKIIKMYPELNNDKYGISNEELFDETKFFDKIKTKFTMLNKPKLNIEEKGSNEFNTSNIVDRKILYQEYIEETQKNSDISKLTFSQYLEKVAPQLTKLIESEKQREILANNIYINYLQYLDSIKGTIVMSFSKYAEKYYGVKELDIPFDKAEEYRKLKK